MSTRSASLLTTLTAVVTALSISGCGEDGPITGPVDVDDRLLIQTSPTPEPKPRPEAGPLRDPPLVSSAELERYYVQYEAQLIDAGKLREDRGTLDALTADTLATNFMRIALYNEYSPVDGAFVAQESSSLLRRWDGPVRVGVHFGDSVLQDARDSDLLDIDELIGELADASGHPIKRTDSRENFSVYVVNEQERLLLGQDLLTMMPDLDHSVVVTMLDILPSTFCLVVAFSASENPQTYLRAVAIIRAEHPPVLRRACFHEELAQGLGLANDNRDVRPTIFNDDEEFALLTVQDRLMLKMLYDPRLSPGMDVATADPIVRVIATELLQPPAADPAPAEDLPTEAIAVSDAPDTVSPLIADTPGQPLPQPIEQAQN